MEMKAWTTLSPPLRESTMETLKGFKFDTMTPVQESTIPLFMSHKDVVVQAITGSGKTLAFIVPTMEILLGKSTPLKKHDVGALIVTPTRELAVQIATVLADFLKLSPVKLTTQLLIGGTDLDVDTLKFMNDGAHIIIGTPGRIEAFMNAMEHQANFKTLEVLILDEADRLLDLGFTAALSFIFQKIPKQRRTGLFSATQTKAVKDLARVGMRNPVVVNVKITTRATGEEQVIPVSLTNQYMIVDLDKKLSHFIHFLREHQDCKIICYFLTCNVVDYIFKVITHCDFIDRGHVFSIHGQVVQEKRRGIYTRFVGLRTGVLLTTDLASRGLDIADVDWIVQYDPPQNPDAFVHRIGRTARMGRSGNALVLLTPDEVDYVEFLSVKKVPITQAPTPENVEDVGDKIKKAAMADRELYKKSQVAMVSYVRGYKEHHCAYIFDLKKLNLIDLAKNFALLKIPVMPEFRKKLGVYEGQLSYEEIEKIPFKSAKQEENRLKKLEEDKATRIEKANQLKTEAWKKKSEARAKQVDSQKNRKTSREKFWDEFEELAGEARAYKRMKRHIISTDEYDEKVGNTALMGMIRSDVKSAKDKDDEGDAEVTEETPKSDDKIAVATLSKSQKKRLKNKNKSNAKP